MTIVYFDSSAFIKLLVEEAGSKLAAALWNGCDAAVSSRLAYPEVRAALAADGRTLRLDAKEQSHAQSLWEDFWAATRPVEFTEPVAAHAGALASRYSLRGTDAVHLASLLAVSSTETVFAVWDEGLRAGAAAAGIRTAPTA